jgi:hypothetical protein
LRHAYANPDLTSQYQRLITLCNQVCPALTGAAPSTYTRSYTGELASFGWLRLVPLQAYKEFHLNNGSYSDFLSTYDTSTGFRNQSNKVIDALNASSTYLDGVYSNMNDLVTADIAGISLSLFYWGQDLIQSGRAIDLSNIDNFGDPAVLLRTLYKNRAFSKSLNLALLSAGFSATEIDQLTNGVDATIEQQKRLFAAFMIITGIDLEEVLIPINCQTKGLTSLADLLNPAKLFPNSYQTLTVPEYNAIPGPTNSKTYYPIYNGTDTSSQVISRYGSKLESIYPVNLAAACEAFSASMMQVKKIKNMNIEKFSQVVSNLEIVSDLNVNNTSIPTNQSIASSSLALVAKGSGPGGRYTMCDFFGAMSGITYNWKRLEAQIKDVETSLLYAAYDELDTRILAVDSETFIQDIDNAIDAIVIIINDIHTHNQVKVMELNQTYAMFGMYLQKEQDARDIALKGVADLQTSATDIYCFIQSTSQYAAETEQYGHVQVLESISDVSTVGGNSIIGGMRETRNALRLGLVGAEQDNEVGTEKLSLPKVNGEVPSKTVINPITNTPVSTPLVTTGPLIGLPVFTGGSTGNGSLGTSPETTLIPSNLDVIDTSNSILPSALTPSQAVDQVVVNNCDCWT